MSLFSQIRDEIVDSSISMAAVLRRAKILASSLRQTELKSWISNELNGYADDSDLPPYRCLHVALLGTFVGPFGQQISHYMIPISMLPSSLRGGAQELPLFHSVREIEGMIAAGGEDLRHAWPTEAVVLSRDRIVLSGGFTLFELYQPVTKANLEGILDAVRNRLLDFLLELRELDPAVAESEEAIAALPRDQVAQLFNVTVFGDHNVLATGSHIAQETRQRVATGDLEGLLAAVREFGVPEPDIEELRRVVSEEPAGNVRRLGDGAKKWLGTMMTKAAQGSWNVALAVAPKVLTKFLMQYYGLEEGS